jgi:hypothetical protein
VVPTANWGGAGDRDRMLFGGKSDAVFSYRRNPCHISFGIGMRALSAPAQGGMQTHRPRADQEDLPTGRSRSPSRPCSFRATGSRNVIIAPV